MPTVANTSTTTYWPTTHELPYDERWDFTLGLICLLSMFFGTIGNTLSVIYFCYQRKDLPTKIYLLMSATDTVTCLAVLPTALSFLSFTRLPLVFQDEAMCFLMRGLWAITPYFSVFLVLVLSIVRTVVLLSPFMRTSHRATMAIIVFYLFYLLLSVIVPSVMKLGTSSYWRRYTMCVEFFTTTSNYNQYRVLSNAVQLAVPVIPIIASCIVSCWCLMKSRKQSADQRKLTKVRSLISGDARAIKKRFSTRSTTKDRQMRATTTIIMVTATYVFFNIPVFISYACFVIDSEVLLTRFMEFYGWNVVIVVLVVCNAATNPIIYFSRIAKMRDFYSRKRVAQFLIRITKRVVRCGKDTDDNTYRSNTYSTVSVHLDL